MIEKISSIFSTETNTTERQLSVKAIENSLQRTISTAERDGIQAALEAVDSQKNHLKEEGLSRVSFFLGCVGVVVVALVFAKYPEHLWLLYGVQCALLIPAWFCQMTRLYNGALFIFDYCWVVNICFGLYMALSFFNVIPASLQSRMFLMFFASAQGPLGWACVLLHNGLVFHNIEKMASLFIHFNPIIVSFTMVYYPDELATAWPNRFPGVKELEGFTMLDVYLHGLLFYMAWWVPYTLWLVSSGVNCPNRGRATVFGNLYTKNKLQKSLPGKSIRSHAMIYLVVHCVAVSVAFVWAAACFRFVAFHFAFGVFVFLSAAWNGASYYEYIIASSYTKVLNNLLNEKKSPLLHS